MTRALTRTRLYHKNVFWPRGKFRDVPGVVYPIYLAHAIAQANEEKYGVIRQPTSFVFSESNVIEMEVDSGRMIKFVTRLHYDDLLDLILVVKVEDGCYYVKTMWLNEKKDTHKTLQVWKYDRR